MRYIETDAGHVIDIQSRTEYNQTLNLHTRLHRAINDAGYRDLESELHLVPIEHREVLSEATKLSNLIINSLLHYNYRYSTTNKNGKDIAENRKRNRLNNR